MRMLAMLLVWISVISVGPVYALRCATTLVTEGDYKIDVRHKCGEPVSIEARRGYKTLHLLHTPHFVQKKITIPIAIEEWLYNFGPHRFMRLLRFENGRLTTIRALGYGY
ncbi:hypothetical protein NKDENANG_03008 [Candidatus Entotheonellaceae bacterium PAL068K]